MRPLYTEPTSRGSRTSEACRGSRPTPAGRGRRCTRAAVDDPAVCGLLDGGGVERLLPQGAGGGAAGGVGRLRPRDAPRLRQRPPAGGRRRRQGRGRDRLGRGHEGAVRRHPAREDIGVDDDERGGDPDPRELHRRRRGAGGAAGRARRGRSRTTSSRSSWSGTPTSIRPSPRCGSSSDIIAYTARRDAEVQLDLDLRLPHAGGGREPRCRSSASRWPTAASTCGRRSRRGWTSTPSPGGCRSSSPSA